VDKTSSPPLLSRYLSKLVFFFSPIFFISGPETLIDSFFLMTVWKIFLNFWKLSVPFSFFFRVDPLLQALWFNFTCFLGLLFWYFDKKLKGFFRVILICLLL